MIWLQHHLPQLLFVTLVLATGIVWLRMAYGGRGNPAARGFLGGRRDPDRFACRVEVLQEIENEKPRTYFSVRMRGRTQVPCCQFETDIQLRIQDVTEGVRHSRPVHTSADAWRSSPDKSEFVFRGYNGRVPDPDSILSHWVQILKCPADALILSHPGDRKLQFTITLFPRGEDTPLQAASTTIPWRIRSVATAGVTELASATPDAAENDLDQFAEGVCLQIAVAVGSLTGPLSEASINILQDWIQHKIRNIAQPHRKDRLTVLLPESFQAMLGEPIETSALEIITACCDISPNLSSSERYQMIRLCILITASNGRITQAETALLEQIAAALAVDPARFRAMAQKLLPVDSQNQDNLEFILGIRPDMTPEQARLRLNEEYQKWNARVTHPDPHIQTQAEQMLRLIGQARNEYVTVGG
jgi:hypothetical protein